MLDISAIREPLVVEEPVLAYVDFAPNFSSSLALCAGTKRLPPEEKFGRPPWPATDSPTTLGITAEQEN